MKRWTLWTFIAVLFAAAFTMGCATLDEKQRAWIFQPSDRSWGGSAELARDMDSVWIEFESKVTSQPRSCTASGPPRTNTPTTDRCCCTCTARAGTSKARRRASTA